MSTSTTDVRDLLAGAASTGMISSATSTLLTGSLGAVVIAGAAGRDAEEIQASDVTLITVLLDASSSIASRGLEQAVREGYNHLVDAFLTTKERDAIMVSLWTFNDEAKVIHAHVPVADAATLDASNYGAEGTTHLYDTWCEALAANIAYAQRLRDSGTPCRSVVVIITDGEDVGSRRRAKDCARVSRDLLASEQFVLAFVGVGDDVDYQSVGLAMGVPAGCILVQRDATPAALRKTFHMVSRSAILVSQSRIAPGAQAGFFN